MSDDKHDAEQWRKWKEILDAPVNRITELELRVKELEARERKVESYAVAHRLMETDLEQSKKSEAKLRKGLLAIREHQALNNQLTGRPIHRSRTIAMIDAALKETKDQ